MIMVGLFGFCSVGVFGLGHNFCDLSSRTDDRHRPPVLRSRANLAILVTVLTGFFKNAGGGSTPEQGMSCT